MNGNDDFRWARVGLRVPTRGTECHMLELGHVIVARVGSGGINTSIAAYCLSSSFFYHTHISAFPKLLR